MELVRAITPIDGRYREQLNFLEDYFSEHALIRERVKIEIEYLIKFVEEVENPKITYLPADWKELLRGIYENFSVKDAERIKEIESTVGHDVFAVVRFLMERIDSCGFNVLKPYVHIGLTSEDVNNLAYSKLLKRFNDEVLLPTLLKLVDELSRLSLENISIVMLARTHGIAAVPTTFGRFLVNYAYRVARIAEEISSTKFPGKLGGAVGDHNALKLVYPEIDWVLFSKYFVECQGLIYFPASTQILPHEQLSSYMMKIAILDSILSNLCRDLWMLSLIGYISFKAGGGEVHSSTMPHKSNPIFLENAEGAFDLSSELSSYISRRLLSSRLHRDLSDSIIKRFYGLPLSLTYLGIQNLILSLNRVEISKERMFSDVREHPEVLTEAYQVLLRRHGHPEAYETIQKLIREKPDKVLEELEKQLPPEIFAKLARLTPLEYLGEAERIVKLLTQEIEEIKNKLRV